MDRRLRALGISMVVAGAGLRAASTLFLPAPLAPVPLNATGSTNVPGLTRQGLVLPMGSGSAPDGLQVGRPSVLLDRGVYRMWYFEVATSWYAQIAYATSPDGRTWTKLGAVLSPSYPGEGHDVAYPSVLLTNGTYWMWYNGFDGSAYRVFAATSPDGAHWTKHGVVLDVGGSGAGDSASLAYPFVLDVNGKFYMWYTGLTSFSPPDHGVILLATSTDGLNWSERGVALTHGPQGSLDSYNVMSPSVAWDGSQFVMAYAGESAHLTSRILYAVSVDGVHWRKAGPALESDPPSEDYLAQPDLLVGPDGAWSVYYVVRNGTSDLQIYLATGRVPSGPPPDNGGTGGSSASLAPRFGGLAPLAIVTSMTGAGAVTGAAIGALVLRPRPRRRT